MPDDVVALQQTPSRGTPISAVVTELLQIMELHAPLPDAGATTASELQTPEQSGASPPEASGNADAHSSYGTGLGKQGFADYAKAAIPKALNDLVEAPPPPRMIGFAAWQDLAKEQAEAAKKTVAAMRALEEAVEVERGKPEVKKWETIIDLVSNAMTTNADIDLSVFDMGLIPADKIDEQFASLQDGYDAAMKDLGKAKARLAESQTMSPDRAAAALRLIDDPRNNPERQQVTQALQQLEATSKKLDGKTKEQAAAQFSELVQIQGVLASWNDRRARQDLPPSAEAIALGDLVQKMQREVIKGIVARKDDLPLPTTLDEKQTKQAKQAWKNLVASGERDDWQPREGDRIGIPVPKDGQRVKTKLGLPGNKTVDATQAGQFRIDILSDLAMLLQTDAGRSLVNQLNDGKHKVRIQPGEEAAQSNDDPLSASPKTKGQGGSSTVMIPPGGKDSDMMLATKGGNVLTAPQFIVVGHELIHALHSSRGVSQQKDDPDKIPDAEMKKWKAGGLDNNAQWTDMEEYRTIAKGKLSEQTLRAQFGLSAERYGHASPKAGDSVKQAFEGAIKDYRTVEANQKKVDEQILDRKLDPAALTDRQKLALLQSDAAGPLPDGWPASQLSPEQIKAIVVNQLDFRAFQRLGWSPFDLDEKTIVDYVKHEAFNDRSPTGLAYRALGSDQAFAAINSFSKATRTVMPAAPSGEQASPFTGVCTTQKLAVLEQARKVLDKFLTDAKDELNPEMRDQALAPGKLAKRLQSAVGAYKIAASGVTASFEPANLDARLKDIKVNETKLVGTMLAAMKLVGERLKLNEQGHAEGADIDGAIAKAREAVLACQQARGGILSGKETENRKAVCTDFTKHLDSLEARANAVRLRAKSSLNKIRSAQGYTAGDIQTLETLLVTPLIDPYLHQGIQNTLGDARIWVAKGQK